MRRKEREEGTSHSTLKPPGTWGHAEFAAMTRSAEEGMVVVEIRRPPYARQDDLMTRADPADTRPDQIYGTRGGRGVSMDPTTRRTKPLREGPVVVLEGHLHASRSWDEAGSLLCDREGCSGGKGGKSLGNRDQSVYLGTRETLREYGRPSRRGTSYRSV